MRVQAMNDESKTLYIPLYGKAFVSQRGIILQDKRAEEIWEKEKFPLRGKASSKWLAYYMAMRARVFDRWVQEKIAEQPDGIVLHLGCGLDCRAERVGGASALWFDVDFEAVINERRRYYTETDNYHMVPADIRDTTFIEALPPVSRAIVVLEGVSMYLTNGQLKELFTNLSSRFEHLSVLIDCYTPFAAKMSKVKNPIKEVGVSTVYGIESAGILEEGTGLTFIKEHAMTPQDLINDLPKSERFLFKVLYGGGAANRLYKLYEYKR